MSSWPTIPTVKMVREAVEAAWELQPGDSLTRRWRDPTRCLVRQVTAWVCRQVTDHTAEQIGIALDRHHTTVIHAWAVIDRRRAEDTELRLRIDALLAGLVPPDVVEVQRKARAAAEVLGALASLDPTAVHQGLCIARLTTEQRRRLAALFGEIADRVEGRAA